MTSYFEKLTSINTSSLNLVGAKFQVGATSAASSSSTPAADLPSALEKIEELKSLNTKLELDLKCEHDEKSDLVSLKVGLESEILELREVNERLEFQVEQLKDEKDKIHHVLAKIREDLDKDRTGMFIASSMGPGSSGVMKRFPSLDDLSLPSSPTDSNRATTCVTPTSTHSGQLERIDEIDETLLESLVMSSKQEYSSEPPQQQNGSSSSSTTSTTLDQLMKRIAFLESENEILRRNEHCQRCRKRMSRSTAPRGVIFEHDDEGLVLSAVDDDDDDDDDMEAEETNTLQQNAIAQQQDNVDEEQISQILEMQRKIIEKLEREVFMALEEHAGGGATSGSGVRDELSRMKRELERKMNSIVRRARSGDVGESAPGESHEHASFQDGAK